MPNPLGPQRRRVTVVNLLLVLVLVAAALWTYQRVNGGNSSASTAVRTTTARLTDVTATVSATGSVTDPSEVGVDFASSGTLTSIRVKLGQRVRKGQVLATIDPTTMRNAYNQQRATVSSASANIAQAKAGVQQAQLSLTQARYNATQATAATSPTSSAMLQAQQTLWQAQVAFNNGVLSDTQTSQNLASLKQAWDDASAKVTSLQSTNSVNSQKYDQSVTNAYTTLNNDYTAYQQAATTYSNYVTSNSAYLDQTKGSQGVCSLTVSPVTDTATAILNTCIADQNKSTQAYTAWTNDQTTYNIAVASRTNGLAADASAGTAAVNAAAQAAQAYQNAIAAQQANGTLNTQINAQALKIAQAKYNDTVASLQNAQVQAENAVIAAQNAVKQAQNNVIASQASLQNANAALAVAATNLADTTLTAPVAGRVASISGSVGQTVSSGSGSSSIASSASSASSGTVSGFIVLTGVSALRVQASVTEGDAGNVKIGQPATFTFDALNGATTTGKVSWVDLVGTTSGGVTSYGVTLDMDTVPAGLKPGMSASVTITTASATNVLAVPATSVTTTGSRSTVTVVTTDANGKQTLTRTNVTVGLKGDSMTEITSGLSAGQEVEFGSTSSTGANGFPTGGIPGAGGLGGFGGGGSFGALRRATQG